MDGLVDIHAHVLPGIDDGPASIEESVAMIAAAVETGITTLAATPHLRGDFPDVRVGEIARRLQELRAASPDAHRIELVTGAEVALTWAVNADDDELRLASYGQRGTDLLVESPSTPLFMLERMLQMLQTKGFRITLAHPERSQEFQQKPERLERLAADGILLLVNAESVLGDGSGSRIRRFARQLCSQGLAHELASDAHRGSGWRPIGRLAQARELLDELVGPARAEWMASAVPAAILQGSPLPTEPPVAPSAPERPRRFGFLRR
jgi:protein-tyrosine phosphatase